MAPLWMAKETGALMKEGVEVEVISMTASVALPALIAAELDAIEISGAPVLTAGRPQENRAFTERRPALPHRREYANICGLSRRPNFWWRRGSAGQLPT